MKRIVYLLTATGMVLSLGACGAPAQEADTTTTEPEVVEVTKQSASAYLDQEKNTVVATIDLTDGWSVEFARGAFYLYDEEISGDTEATAIGITLDNEVYKEDLAEAIESASHEEADGGIYYDRSDNAHCFLCTVDDSAYFLLVTESNDIKDIRGRISLKLDR